jgi:hypothetical protein
MHRIEGKTKEVDKRSVHRDHETSPLFDLKMPKAKPIVKLVEHASKIAPNDSHLERMRA